MGKRTVSYEIDTTFPDDVTPRVLKAMRDDGMSLRQLAEKYNVSHETIRKNIKQAEELDKEKPAQVADA